ncbi:hypothetical protein V5799_025498 [Amblyomma americanum]|uniref:FP protein C-terminal domain-containing protein n=1 Tax=Amblyomma americanum TaxID=6943 RepID=A0AAQ4E932_AMBAM
MPNCDELSKRIDELQSKPEVDIDRLVDKIFDKLVLKFESSGRDILKVKSQIDSFESSVVSLTQHVEELRNENSLLAADNQVLKSRKSELASKIGGLEQYSRMNNVEVKGVPCTQGEDCVTIIQMVTPVDLDVAHRVPTKNENQNILARFFSRTKKADFMSKVRKACLTLFKIDIGASEDSPFFFVNDHLTAENKALFSKVLSLKKQKKRKFLWTDNCMIKARKTTDSTVCPITNESNLSQIV